MRAAEKIGKGAEKYAFHIKGSDLPLHDGRGKTAMAMGFALSSTGGDHVETPHDVAFQGESYNALSAVGITEPVRPLDLDEDKVRFFKVGQLSWGINNLLSICNFCSIPIHAMTYHNLVESVRAITGWDTSLFEILQASERSMVMSRKIIAAKVFEEKTMSHVVPGSIMQAALQKLGVIPSFSRPKVSDDNPYCR